MLRSDPKPGAPVHYPGWRTPDTESNAHARRHNIGLCREYWCKLTLEPSEVTCESCKLVLAFNVNVALAGGPT